MAWQDITFSPDELARYNRHLIIPGFGPEAQQKLKAAKVLVVGTGGLGAPLLQYLTAAGVGTIGVVDMDTVDASNLQRQVLFDMQDVGKPKVLAAVERLQAQNPFVKFEVYNTQLTSENALDIVAGYDVVADGTDNFPTRYLVNDACVLLGKTNVYASIFQFDGQVSVFNYQDPNRQPGDRPAPNYRCLYPEPPPPGLVPSCAEGGVLGVLPGIIGSLQALEVIKVITGVGDPLVGRLYTFDALTFQSRILKFKFDPNNPLNGDRPTITKLIDYEQFCGLKPPAGQKPEVAEITVQELAQWLAEGKDFQLIDVREVFEYEIANLGGELIPLAQVPQRHDLIDRDRPVVIHCKMGGRSANAVKLLQNDFGFDNLYNLRGGIIAYAKEVDPSVPTY